MPINIERRELVSTRLSRLSGIPRPLKQLEVNGLSHSSKPSINAIPLTPAKKTALNVRLRVAKPDPEIPTLELVPFGRQPAVDFGHVSLGQTQIKHLTIRNVLDTPQQLFVINFPKADKGFNIDATEFLLAPRTAIYVVLSWTPNAVGASRETITLQDANRMPRRVILLGVATRGKPETFKKPPNFPKVCPRKPNLVEKPIPSQNKFAPIAAKRFAATDSRPLTRLRGSPNIRRQSAQIVTKLLKHDEAMIIKIQSHWRRILVLRQFAILKKRNNAAKCIQKYWREFLTRRKIQRQREAAAIRIQKCWREYVKRRDHLILREKSALRIQRHWRRYVVRRDLVRLRHKSATCIQRNWREFIRRRDFLRLRLRAAICIQKQWKEYIKRRELRKVRDRSAICIQRHWRLFVKKRDYQRLRERSAACIQRNWREYIRRRDLLRLQVRSARLIQRCWKNYIERRDYRRLCERSAVCIQRHWRGLIRRREFLELKRTVLLMQVRWRLRKARRSTARLILLHSESKILLCQWKNTLLKVERTHKTLNSIPEVHCK